MSDSGNPPCNFFRKPSKPKNLRKRKSSPSQSSSDSDSTPSALPPSKKPVAAADNKLRFSSSTSTPNPTPTLFQFQSSNQIQQQTDNLATATLQTETDFSSDARAIRERVLKKAEASLNNPSKPSDEKLYKGIHGYTDYKAGFRREQTVAGEKAGGSHGPLRASAHIRLSARFDYQPDICKDYKETGYCGFGDSCKFMHDRGDYKSGWQLEKEWEEAEKARKRELAMGGGRDGGEEGGEGQSDDDDEDEDGLPFACFICREPFQNPVVTKCKHYFCEHCALKHHSTNKKCFVCNKPTLGLFNTAHDVLKKIGQQK